MVRRRRAEVHVNQERWLVSYADFITLLFAFFVVMYSISQVNQSKYRVLSETFVQAFNSPSHSLPSPETDADSQMPGSLTPIQVGEPARTPAPSAIDVRNEHTGFNDSDKRDVFTELADIFAERFASLIDQQLLSVSSNELWLQIELKDSILFTSGSAEPGAQAQSIFDEIAQILQDYPHGIQVEGHTDNVPVNLPRYPSNWELSAARAAAIVKWLASKGVNPAQLSAVGYGEFQPIADNDTADGRAQNRRVALMIARQSTARPMTPVSSAHDTNEISSPVESNSSTSGETTSLQTPATSDSLPAATSVQGQ